MFSLNHSDCYGASDERNGANVVVGLAQVRRMEVFVPVFVLCEKLECVGTYSQHRLKSIKKC